MDGDVLRFGLIGAGRWGRNYIGTIATLGGVELAWIVDPDPRVKAKTAPRCPFFDNLQTALQSGSVDGVIIASPPSCHDRDIRGAVAEGLPVLVEKPLVLSAQAARDLLAFVEERGGFVLVDHIHLFHPGYRKLKEMASPLGSVTSLQSVGGNWGPFRPETSVLWDWGPHDVALCLDLMGKSPMAVNARYQEKEETPEGPGEILAIELVFDGDVRASIEIGNLFREKRRSLQVAFGNQTFLLDDTTTDKLTRWVVSQGSPEKFEPVAIDDEPPLSCVVQAFAKTVRAKSKDTTPLKFGAQLVDILEQCECALSE